MFVRLHLCPTAGQHGKEPIRTLPAVNTGPSPRSGRRSRGAIRRGASAPASRRADSLPRGASGPRRTPRAESRVLAKGPSWELRQQLRRAGSAAAPLPVAAGCAALALRLLPGTGQSSRSRSRSRGHARAAPAATTTLRPSPVPHTHAASAPDRRCDTLLISSQ